MKISLIASLVSLFLSVSASQIALADGAPVHGFTATQMQEMTEHNQKLAANTFINDLFGAVNGNTSALNGPVAQVIPVAEYLPAGYLIFNDGIDFDSLLAKRTMAKTLPADVTLVIYTGIKHPSAKEQLIKAMTPYISEDRLKIIYLPGGNRGFWTRDGVPVPVWKLDADGNEQFTVVDAKYYHGFEADQEIANFFGADIFKHSYNYEGGNFMTNSKGDCIMINTQAAAMIPDKIMTDQYGCKTLERLPHVKGIGHADESIKWINDTTLITDTPSYAKVMQDRGFTVKMIPRPDTELETYVNSLIVNGTVYVPVFNEKNDAEALKVYTDLGLNAVPIVSNTLSNQGMGSIHCITMTYPPVPFKELLSQTGGTEIK